MKVYSITEGARSPARTSSAHTRAFSNGKRIREGPTDPSSGSAGHARGLETSHQTRGGPEAGVPAVRRTAAQTAGNRAPRKSHDLRTRGGSATAFARPRVVAALVSSHSAVHGVDGRTAQPPLARSGHAGRLRLAVSPGQWPAQAAEWSPHQGGRDASADSPGRPAARSPTARGGGACLLRRGFSGPLASAC